MSATLVGFLRESALRHPEACALEAAGEETSFAALWSRAVDLASALARSGVDPGDRVALALPNSVAYVAAFYGALMAGAVVVPMNTAARSRDLDAWLRHSGARVVIAEPRNRELDICLEQSASSRLVLRVNANDGSIAGPVAAGGSPRELPEPLPGQQAAILYTSGTTGRPKGVLLSHGNLASNAAAIVAYLRLKGQDSIVNVLPFYYSYGNSVLHSHIMAGARLILEANFVYPHSVVDTLARRRATGFSGVPSTFSLLLARVSLQDYDLTSLRYVTQAGGPMPPAVGQRLRAALPGTAVVIMYGQTEATARLTWLPPGDLDRKIGSVGIPIPGVDVQVRLEDGRRAGPGEEGEVWAHGPNVMLGYWNDQEATASVLRDGWLRTGDSGYMDEEGYLFLKGRRSDIIKVGAHRIHPGEVENTVMELDGVDEAAAIGVDDELLGQVIKVFVVARPGSGVTPMRVQAHCRDQLASYKVPKHVEMVGALPRTTSGKVRRAALAREV